MSTEFEQIQDRYYNAWFRFHPEEAVEVGVPGYAHMLASFGDDDMGALITLNEKLLASLEELDESRLSHDQLTDLELMRGAAFLEIERLMGFDWRISDPQQYLPLNAIYQLTIRDIPNFDAALRQRLGATPAHLRNARSYISREPERIPSLWLESAVATAEAGVGFLRGLSRNPKVAGALAAEELEALIDESIDALTEYASFLRTDIGDRAQGDFSAGRQYFGHLLRYRHHLDIEADALHAFGARLFEQTKRDLEQVCRDLTGSSDVAALATRIQSDHPQPDDLLHEYEQQVQAARRFVAKHELVTLPPIEHLAVVDTPVFLRQQVPFAAYQEPSPSDPEQRGYYFVTPASSTDELAEHNYHGIKHTCVHESYPGHHLQFSIANGRESARSLPRLLNSSSTMYEGWALYCEQLMCEQGFMDRPENRFILLKDRLWRAMRIVIDVEIHTRGRSAEDAADGMARALGFPVSQAMADVTWYSRAPTTPMGYATGWAMINAARDRLQVERPELYLARFHDQLLSHGSMALTRVLGHAFGEDLLQSVRKMVFG